MHEGAIPTATFFPLPGRGKIEMGVTFYLSFPNACIGNPHQSEVAAVSRDSTLPPSF